MKTYTSIQVIKMAGQMGVHIERDKDKFDKSHGEIRAEAPANKCFGCDTSLHGLVSEANEDTTWAEAWQEMGERLSYGLEDCNCGECDA